MSSKEEVRILLSIMRSKSDRLTAPIVKGLPKDMYYLDYTGQKVSFRPFKAYAGEIPIDPFSHPSDVIIRYMLKWIIFVKDINMENLILVDQNGDEQPYYKFRKVI